MNAHRNPKRAPKFDNAEHRLVVDALGEDVVALGLRRPCNGRKLSATRGHTHGQVRYLTCFSEIEFWTGVEEVWTRNMVQTLYKIYPRGHPREVLDRIRTSFLVQTSPNPIQNPLSKNPAEYPSCPYMTPLKLSATSRVAEG